MAEICEICGIRKHKEKCKGIRPSNLMLPWPEWEKFKWKAIGKVDKDTEYWLRDTGLRELISGCMNDKKRREARLNHYLGFIDGIKYMEEENE